MTEDSLFLPGLSPVDGKPVRVAFDSGLRSSDGGVLLLREIDGEARDRRPAGGLHPRKAAAPALSTRRLRFHGFAIAAGYEDASCVGDFRPNSSSRTASTLNSLLNLCRLPIRHLLPDNNPVQNCPGNPG